MTDQTAVMSNVDIHDFIKRKYSSRIHDTVSYHPTLGLECKDKTIVVKISLTFNDIGMYCVSLVVKSHKMMYKLIHHLVKKENICAVKKTVTIYSMSTLSRSLGVILNSQY
jgi:hypothetical protein